MRFYVSSHFVAAALMAGSFLAGCSAPWDYVGPLDTLGDAAFEDFGDANIPGSSSSGSSGAVGIGSSGGGPSSSSGAVGVGSSSSGSGEFGSSSGGSTSSSSGVGGSGSGSSSSSGGSSSGGRVSGSSSGAAGSGSSSGGGVGGPGQNCPAGGVAPTWSSIWSKDGFSSTCPKCHSGQTKTATAAYTWLQQQHFISGTTSTIIVQSMSPLMIFNGSMPPNGSGINNAAVCALVDWVAAGAQNN
jgi:hypothetical protein